MQRDVKHLFRVSVIILLFLIIGGYAIYQSQKWLEGPKITIEEPRNGETVTDSLLSIKGVAKNINSISLDDRPIFIDEDGNFNEKLLLYPGYNIMKIEARDKFGKDKILTLEVNYKAPENEFGGPGLPSTGQAGGPATSTASTSVSSKTASSTSTTSPAF